MIPLSDADKDILNNTQQEGKDISKNSNWDEDWEIIFI